MIASAQCEKHEMRGIVQLQSSQVLKSFASPSRTCSLENENSLCLILPHFGIKVKRTLLLNYAVLSVLLGYTCGDSTTASKCT